MYLGSGESFASLGYSSRVGKNIIKGIWKILQPIFMAVPTSVEWLRIAYEFKNICKMPNCIGRIDEKHRHIKCPQNAGFFYLNYKSFHSINLSGVDDTNCCFALIDVGTHGRENNSSVFSNSSFGKAFNFGDLNVPPMRNIPGTSIIIPLYFVGEEAFSLQPNLMKPFQGETSISQKPYSMANFLVHGERLDALLAY
jgi:hypothetical protein